MTPTPSVVGADEKSSPQRDTPAWSQWATLGLGGAMRLAQIGAASLLQLAFVAAAFTSQATLSPLTLAVLHLVTFLVGAVVLACKLPAGVFVGFLHVVLAVDLAVVATPSQPLFVLALGAAMCTSPTPLLIFPGRWPIVVSAGIAAGHCIVVAAAHADWETNALGTMIIALGSVWIVAIALVSPLRRMARRTDRFIDRADADEYDVIRARMVSDAHTESIRLLHDTVINTLGALARDGVGQHSLGSVRRRCRRDIEQVSALTDPQAADRDSPRRFFELDGLGLLPVTLEGMDTFELGRHEALLPAPTARALRGCVEEVVRNATKHSGAERVLLTTTRIGRELVVSVRDDGAGFDGEPIPGRGLAESVFARACDHGMQVELESAPGHGTTVEFRCALDQGGGEIPERAVAADGIVDGLRRRLCWTWAIAILAEELLRVVVTTEDRFPVPLALVGVSAVLSMLAWLTTRRGRPLPAWLTVIVLTACPAAALVALWAVDFGRASPYLFDALSVTELPVLLLVLRRTVAEFAVAVVLTALVVPVAVMLHPGLGATDVQLLLIMMAVPLAVLLAWKIWSNQIGVLGRALAAGRQRSWDARLELAARAAAESARTRWNAASLESALDLLRGIAEGVLQPADPSVRSQCADEERHLRGAISLRPDAGALSRELALALAIARSRSVRLRLQPGAAEPPDRVTARAFGRLVVAIVSEAPPDSEVVVSVVDYGGSLRLFIVGDGPGVIRTDNFPEITGCHVCTEVLGAQTLLEATWVGAAAAPPAGRTVTRDVPDTHLGDAACRVRHRVGDGSDGRLMVSRSSCFTGEAHTVSSRGPR